MHRARITVERSPALAESSGFPAETRTFVVPLPDGPWLQFTYESMRDHDGGFSHLSFDGAVWRTDDDAPWSDVVVQVTEDPTAVDPDGGDRLRVPPSGLAADHLLAVSGSGPDDRAGGGR